MQLADWWVLGGYLTLTAAIGLAMIRRVRGQEDYFLGSRSFGKLLQTFAAFGSGTGPSDPVNLARSVYVAGASGMWAVMYWLFMTPFYWISATWYRRMRVSTLGDWFVERYQSPGLGGAYAAFGIAYFIIYGAMGFAASGAVAAQLVGTDVVSWGDWTVPIELVVIPAIGAVVLLYGVAGGLHAAYWTDLLQGACIIALSLALVPAGLEQLVEEFGEPGRKGWLYGFELLHEQLPAESFQMTGAGATAFTPGFVLGLIVLNLAGVAVQPHFIATGGGAARSEFDARVGLVAGNLLKRFCTIGWLVSALIAAALYAGDAVLAANPDRAWGVASTRLLAPGLVGLMLACLLAALMSSVDAYMIVGSALAVRNLYAPFMNPQVDDAASLRIARWTSGVIVCGAVATAIGVRDVFRLLELTWLAPVLFAAPFWVGKYWRRATTAAAWATVAFSLVVFFLLPWVRPGFSVYRLAGIDVALLPAGWRDLAPLAPQIALPFVVMVLTSLATRSREDDALIRHFVKMRLPVLPDSAADARQLAAAYADPATTESRKLWPDSAWEFNRPTRVDVAGIVATVGLCVVLLVLTQGVLALGAN
ncbi:MAG: hypothetical protein KF688_19475 [Pirellulales bacterium]|nr:hypothetical protein [Pirellulales bacterium]